jgi:hypothetical protein
MSANRSSRWSGPQAWRARVFTLLSFSWLPSVSPTRANSSSNTQRMVNTVGPASSKVLSIASGRILPPGPSAASSTSTSWPCAASSKAVVRPPTPAPTTITRCVNTD